MQYRPTLADTDTNNSQMNQFKVILDMEISAEHITSKYWYYLKSFTGINP